MTVKELMEELEKIENKEEQIFIATEKEDLEQIDFIHSEFNYITIYTRE